MGLFFCTLVVPSVQLAADELIQNPKASIRMDVGAFLIDMELHPTDDNKKHEYSDSDIIKRIK